MTTRIPSTLFFLEPHYNREGPAYRSLFMPPHFINLSRVKFLTVCWWRLCWIVSKFMLVTVYQPSAFPKGRDYEGPYTRSTIQFMSELTGTCKIPFHHRSIPYLLALCISLLLPHKPGDTPNHSSQTKEPNNTDTNNGTCRNTFRRPRCSRAWVSWR
jgi:hypothetical protein